MNAMVSEKAAVPRLWPGATVVCIACGPSLTQADVDLVRTEHEAGQLRVIAINAAVRMAPWADVRYAHHAADWCRPEDLEILAAFRGLKYSCELPAADHGATVLRMSGATGLELEDRGAIRHGKNSGYQAINVAVHLGARRILLLGYDLKRSADGQLHFYSCTGRQGKNDFDTWARHFATLPGPLAAAGVEVVNATRETDLPTFPRMSLEAALAAR
jgi:hypothetical protein